MPTLREELVLVSLDERGTWPVASELVLALAGAALCELIFAERLALEGDRVLVRDRSLTGDDALDAWLEKVAAKDKVRKLGHWLGWGRVEILRPTVDRLVEAGVLEVKRWRLGHRYPEANTGVGSAVREQVRATLVDGATVDARALALVALALACGLHKRLLAERPPSEVSALVAAAFERTEASEQQQTVVRALSAAVAKEVQAGRRTMPVG